MKAFVMCVVLIAACGGGSDDAPGDDSPGDDDPAGDDGGTPGADYECPNIGTAPVCGTTTPPTVAASNSDDTCNPLTQAGCAVGEKCGWIKDQDDPPLGHIGCTPDGTVAIGCACSVGAPGATGYDDCVKGATCLAGTCKQVCDNNGGTPTCSPSTACNIYSDYFESSGTTVAGVCDPTCDPLTQCTYEAPASNACGSTDTDAPNRGCYGFDQFACSPALDSTLTDRKLPRTNGSGNAYLNGCAPGFMPFFRSETGSSTVVCAGLCAALETDNTAAHMNNGLGDPAAAAKLPTESKARYGNATCAPGKKGSEATSRCLFMWPYVLDDVTGEVPAEFMPYLDTMGVCFAIEHYTYDADNDMTPDTAWPECSSLPPQSAATPGRFDDAADFSCQKFSNTSQARTVRPGDARILSRAPMSLVRHAL